jgi:hypothetical protein
VHELLNQAERRSNQGLRCDQGNEDGDDVYKPKQYMSNTQVRTGAGHLPEERAVLGAR